MLTLILPLVSFALTAAQPAHAAHRVVAPVEAPVVQAMVHASGRVAQVQLAELLASADAIHGVAAHGMTIRFALDRDGETYQLEVRTHRHGEVVAFALRDAGPAIGELGSLTWLATELAQATAVTALIVDDDGAVTIATSDGRAYMAIPGRGSGGNVATEARWAAAWSSSDS